MKFYNGTYPIPILRPLKHSVGARLKKSNYHKSAVCSVFLEVTSRSLIQSGISVVIGTLWSEPALIVAVIEFSHQGLLANITN